MHHSQLFNCCTSTGWQLSFKTPKICNLRQTGFYENFIQISQVWPQLQPQMESKANLKMYADENWGFLLNLTSWHVTDKKYFWGFLLVSKTFPRFPSLRVQNYNIGVVFSWSIFLRAVIDHMTCYNFNCPKIKLKSALFCLFLCFRSYPK